MTIYRVCFNLTADRHCFFKSFEEALKFIRSSIPGIEYIDGEYFIGGSSAQTYKDNNSLHIRSRGQFDMQYYYNIDPYKLPFELTDDSFWIVYFMKGYTSTVIFGDEPRSEILGEFPSKEDAQYNVEQTEELKHMACQWRAEDASRIDSMGHGEDYLFLKCIHIGRTYININKGNFVI